MEIEAFIKKMKDVYITLIDFIEATDDSDSEFKALIEVLYKQKILQNKEEVRILFQLISKIADNHHQSSNFLNKLEIIFDYIIKDKPIPISDFTPDHNNYNKRILFHLLEKKIIEPDKKFLNTLSRPRSKKNLNINQLFFYYLYPVMKEFIDENQHKQIEDEIKQLFDEDILEFQKKCQIGENDSYICSLIREDSIEEFVSYVNRTNLKLSSQIKPSFFETNPFLIDKEPTLIEYAAFFGSIQIIRYLKYNQVPLTFSLWSYTIHSNNAELIHFLEENEVKPENNIIRKNMPFYIYINSFFCNFNWGLYFLWMFIINTNKYSIFCSFYWK